VSVPLPDSCTGPVIGTYSGRVTCICLGPPPCVSRAVVPRFISTVICGDDAVPRASPGSIDSVKTRVRCNLSRLLADVPVTSSERPLSQRSMKCSPISPSQSPFPFLLLSSQVLKALRAGAGDKMGLRWKVGSGWLADLQSVAGKGSTALHGVEHPCECKQDSPPLLFLTNPMINIVTATARQRHRTVCR
jgi:hypothetical protein